jgi:hypothetical protein
VPDWPLEQLGRVEFIPDAPNPFTGIQLTGGGTAHTMGAWFALGNAPFDCVGILIFARNNSSATDYLVDIGFGAAGSEQVVIESLYVTGPSSSSRSKQYFFPLRIPAGTRVSARCQNATISSTLAMGVSYFAETFKGAPYCDRIVTYGSVRSTSSGTALSAPAAAAWGAWTQIVGATLDDHNWFMPVVGDQDLATRTAQSHAFEVGIGAAASERRVGPPFFFHASSTALGLAYFANYWMRLVGGVRMAGRYSAVAATNLGLDMVIYGGCR